MSKIKFAENRKFDIIPIGRIAIDFNPTDMNRTLDKSKNFNKYLGGSPANIAVGMATLGKKVGFIGKVSNDQFGTFVEDFFIEKGIDTSNIFRGKNGESLGLTFTEMKSETESSILMYRENVADLNLEACVINEEYIKQSKILLISGTALAQSPTREAVFSSLFYAKKNNVKVIFDIDYRNYTWKNKEEIAVYYSLVGQMSDIIIGSREEFTLMEYFINKDNKDDETSAKLWNGFGNEMIVIKHGKEGSTAFTNKGETFKIKPFPVNMLKAFGGGDGYASAFLYGLLEGFDIIDALELGSAEAAMLVSAHSCSEAMPTFTEVEKFIKEKKEKYGENIARG